MPNDFYNHGSFPTTGSAATSASMRAELDSIVAGFDKMPTLTGNANEVVVVNASGTALASLPSLPAISGGTGFTSYAVGDILYAGTTTSLYKLAGVATGNALISGGVGVAPSYGKIGLTTHVSGTLPTANGGTNLTSFTANGVMYASSTSALATGSAFTFDGNGVVVSVNSSTDALRITQNGAGNALLVEDNTNPDATPFVIDANGNVTIANATSVGSYKLEVHGTDALAGYRWNSATTPGVSMRLNRSRSGTVGSYAVVQSNDVVGNVIFSGDDGAAFIPAAQISAQVDGTPGPNDMPGRLVFSTTADGASSPTERMRIDSAGNVGIGTSGLNYRLAVQTTENSRGAAYIQNSGADAWGLEIGTHSSTSESDLVLTANAVVGSQDSLSFVAENTGFFRWMTGGTSHKTGTAGATEAMRIDSSGNVGIGTASPQTGLHVASGATTGGVLRLENTLTSIASGNSWGEIEFYSNDSSTSASGVRAKIQGYANGTTGASQFRFYTTNSSSTTLVNGLTVSPSGILTSVGTFSSSATIYNLFVGNELTIGYSTTFANEISMTNTDTLIDVDLTGYFPQVIEQNNYMKVDVAGIYIANPASITYATSTRLHKSWAQNIAWNGTTYLIAGAVLQYTAYNQDSVNFPAGAVNAAKVLTVVSSSQVLLRLQNRTSPAATSTTNYAYKIEIIRNY